MGLYLVGPALRMAATDAPVTVADQGRNWVLDNGIVRAGAVIGRRRRRGRRS